MYHTIYPDSFPGDGVIPDTISTKGYKRQGDNHYQRNRKNKRQSGLDAGAQLKREEARNYRDTNEKDLESELVIDEKINQEKHLNPIGWYTFGEPIGAELTASAKKKLEDKKNQDWWKHDQVIKLYLDRKK